MGSLHQFFSRWFKTLFSTSKNKVRQDNGANTVPPQSQTQAATSESSSLVEDSLHCQQGYSYDEDMETPQTNTMTYTSIVDVDRNTSFGTSCGFAHNCDDGDGIDYRC